MFGYGEILGLGIRLGLVSKCLWSEVLVTFAVLICVMFILDNFIYSFCKCILLLVVVIHTGLCKLVLQLKYLTFIRHPEP